MRRVTMTLAAGLVALLGLAACGGGSDSAKNAAKKILEKNGVKVKNNGNGVEFSDKNGKSTLSAGGNAQLPTDFPKDDVPLPKGDVVLAASSTSNGKQSFTVTIGTGSDTNTAGDDYQQALKDAGYKIDSRLSLGGNSSGFSAYSATGSKWDVNVIAANDVGNHKGGLLITVTPHDTSNDTTTTSY